MRLHHHLGVSLVISGLLYASFRSVGLATASFVSGVFIDLDHIVDYLREYGWRLDLKLFFRSFHETRYKQVVLVLHGWEWILFWGVVAYLTAWNRWVIGFLIGALHHMILDQAGNHPSRWGYCLLWRWAKNFEVAHVFPTKASKRGA